MTTFVLFTKEDVGPLPKISEQKMVPDMEPIIVTEEGVVNLLKLYSQTKQMVLTKSRPDF